MAAQVAGPATRNGLSLCCLGSWLCPCENGAARLLVLSALDLALTGGEVPRPDSLDKRDIEPANG